MVYRIPRHVCKTTPDVHWGFHQVELEEASMKVTTFTTPWGHYRCRGTPLDYGGAPGVYTRRHNHAILGIPRKLKCIDNIYIYDASVEDTYRHT